MEAQQHGTAHRAYGVIRERIPALSSASEVLLERVKGGGEGAPVAARSLERLASHAKLPSGPHRAVRLAGDAWPELWLAERLWNSPALELRHFGAVAGAVLLARRVAQLPGLEGWGAVAGRALSTLPDERGRVEAGSSQHWLVGWLQAELSAGVGVPIDLPLVGGAPWPGDRAENRLLRSVLEAAARHRLGLPASAAVGLEAQTAWGKLDFGVPEPNTSPMEMLCHYSQPSAHAGKDVPVALVLFAYAVCGRLPPDAPPTAVLRALGVTT